MLCLRITLKYDHELNGFPEEALRAAQATGSLLEVQCGSSDSNKGACNYGIYQLAWNVWETCSDRPLKEEKRLSLY